jgi:hypothetical protein
MTKEILTSKTTGEEWEPVDGSTGSIVGGGEEFRVFRKLKKPEMPEIRPGDVVVTNTIGEASHKIFAIRFPYSDESDISFENRRFFYWDGNDNASFVRGWGINEIHRDGKLLWKRN